MTIKPEDFNYIFDLLKERSGIALAEEKTYLLDSRLLPLIRKLQLNDISELVRKMRTKPDEEIIREVIEAMTTNETLFFRDIKPFDQLRDVIIPEFINSGQKDFKIWSCACSTGQEPYSIAMMILENQAKFSGCNFEIIASDIDRNTLRKAEEAIYTQFEVQRGLPVTLLVKYFAQDGEKWRLGDNVKSMVRFENHNLLDYYNDLAAFDIILCRNVLIYFEIPTRKQILEKISSNLKPHGVLFLGGSETTNNLSEKYDKFKDLKNVFCLKK